MSEKFDIYEMITKKFGDGVMTSGAEILNEPRMIIPISPSFDLGTNGGITEGSWVSITGPEKNGKTILALSIAAQAQKEEYGARDVFYFNIEGRITSMHLSGIKGLILDKPRFNLIRSIEGKILTAQENLEIISEVIKNNPKSVIIIDSFSALCDDKEMTAGIGKETRGGTAKLISQFLRLNNNIVPVNKNIVIGITQLMANTSGFGSPFAEKSATAWRYQKDIALQCKSKKPLLSGDKQIGLETEWVCNCSTLGPPGRKFKSYIRFGIGIDSVFELQELAISLGLIKKTGAWFKIGDQKFQGSEKLYKYLQDNPDKVKELSDLLKEMLQSYSPVLETESEVEE